VTTRGRLVHMANQIARNFATQPDADAALAVADHIAMFWDPRMKALILEPMDASGEGLSPVAHAAIEHLRDKGAPPSQTRATEYQAGHSDAG